MIFNFLNLAQKPMASISLSTLQRVNPHEPEYATHAAIQWLFSATNEAGKREWPPLSTSDMVLVSCATVSVPLTDPGPLILRELEHWSIGPFDLLVWKELEPSDLPVAGAPTLPQEPSE